MRRQRYNFHYFSVVKYSYHKLVLWHQIEVSTLWRQRQFLVLKMPLPPESEQGCKAWNRSEFKNYNVRVQCNEKPAVVLSTFRTYDSAPCTKHLGIHTLGDHVFRKKCLFCYHLEDSFRQLLGWPKQLKFTEHTSAGACKHFVNSVKKSKKFIHNIHNSWSV